MPTAAAKVAFVPCASMRTWAETLPGTDTVLRSGPFLGQPRDTPSARPRALPWLPKTLPADLMAFFATGRPGEVQEAAAALRHATLLRASLGTEVRRGLVIDGACNWGMQLGLFVGTGASVALSTVGYLAQTALSAWQHGLREGRTGLPTLPAQLTRRPAQWVAAVAERVAAVVRAVVWLVHATLVGVAACLGFLAGALAGALFSSLVVALLNERGPYFASLHGGLAHVLEVQRYYRCTDYLLGRMAVERQRMAQLGEQANQATDAAQQAAVSHEIAAIVYTQLGRLEQMERAWAESYLEMVQRTDGGGFSRQLLSDDQLAYATVPLGEDALINWLEEYRDMLGLDPGCAHHADAPGGAPPAHAPSRFVSEGRAFLLQAKQQPLLTSLFFLPLPQIDQVALQKHSLFVAKTKGRIAEWAGLVAKAS